MKNEKSFRCAQSGVTTQVYVEFKKASEHEYYDDEDDFISDVIIRIYKSVEDVTVSQFKFHASDCAIRYAWTSLTKPGGYISFYQGNGESSVHVKEDGYVVFYAMPSGAGGDASHESVFKIDSAIKEAFEYIASVM